MEFSGAKLKQIRLEKGFTLEEASKKTKIQMNILKAIEEDSLVGVNPIYVKGFLKIYCKFLGVNPKEYIPDYKESASKPVQIEVEEAKNAPPKFSLDKFVALLPKLKVLLKVILAVICLVVLFKFAQFTFLKSREFFAKSQKTASPSAVKPQAAQKEKKTSGAQKAEKFPASSSIRLGIHAKENCYITLKSDGKVVFQATLRKGMSDSWVAKEKIEFSLNNAAGADLQVNGKAISSLGRRGQAIKGVIHKDGSLEILR